jgi:hypothetical protein
VPRPARWVAVAALGAVLSSSAPAHTEGLMPSGTTETTEARMVVAYSPASTRAWYSLRVDGTAGDVGVVVPVAAGASIDFGVPAFLDALEVATTPRVIPPAETNVTCAASEGKALVEIEGDLSESATVAPAEAAILDSVDGVRQWAASRSLTVSASLDGKLVASGASHFVVARFSLPAGLARTRPLRVVTPGGAASLPLSLVDAGSQDVAVHAFAIGKHRAVFQAPIATLDVGSLSFDAAAVTTNYDDLFAQALAEPGAVLLQASSHAALRDSVSTGAPNAAPIDSVIKTYFERAAATGEATLDPATCIGQSAVILGQSAIIGTTCPRSAVGVAGGATPCTSDVTDPGEVDPALLRCGGLADDVAVALSDLEPDEAWVTRGVLRIAASSGGADLAATFPGATARVDPVVEASKLDVSGCGEGGSGAGGASTGPSGSSSSGPSGTSSASGGTTVEVPVFAHDGCSCDGTWVVVDYVEEDESSAPDAYYENDDSCSGDTTGDSTSDTSSYESSPSEECSGDTTTSDSTVDDGCSCDGTTDGSDSTSSDACSGDSGSSDSCGGDSGTDDSCSSDSSCAVSRGSKAKKSAARKKKASIFVYGFLVVVAPLRRLTRGKRRARKERRAR